jgi:hypothetical protein
MIKRRLFVNFDPIQNYLTVLLRKRLFRTFFGLITLTLAIFSIPILFSKYSPTFSHTLQHSLFILAMLTSAFLLITDKIVNSFQSLYNTIEVGMFDKLQYTFAKKVKSLANTLRKSQTGELNLNMLGVLIGFIVIFSITILIPF